MNKGFTVVELLITLAIILLIAGAVAQAVPAARAAFDRIPAELEMQQRGRIAIDAMMQAIRAADHVSAAGADDAGRSSELTTISPVAGGAVGMVDVDQAAPGAAIRLGTATCPNIKDVCGFSAGAVAMITDHDGGFDVFIVQAVNTGLRSITPDRQLSRAYPVGSLVIEVEQYTFTLDLQPDGSTSLIRITAAGAVQPIADFMASLAFRIDGPHVEIEVTAARQTEITRRVAGARVFRASIATRNVS